ncbi:PqqD family protein [Paenibacillus tarimensis]|uniref:PqqD family protein n=1 Tax=Paenibacillus tarimensis TaxID=416012 RepID=UPI001F3DB102|nr:PqqD family protein [Paenibacillus tarimensis]MCF2942779.1 PqqD family protein [Paenibacillus tarimensis]
MLLGQREEVYTTDLGDEIVLLDMNNGAYFGLEGATMALWQELGDGPKHASVILARWRQIYEHPSETLEVLLQEAIAHLRQKDLISVSAYEE